MRYLKIVAVSLMICLGLAGCGSTIEEVPRDVKKEANEETQEFQQEELSQNAALTMEELTVHFIDVGQGDAALITCGGEAMLVDAGDNAQGTKLQYYLRKQGVEKLKYVIGTHPDTDHIGGLDVILYKFDCETIIMPEGEKDTAAYRDVIAAMEEKGYKKTLPQAGDTYALGDAEFVILSPAREYEDSNNNSVVFLLKHGENSFLFTGDAEEEAEKDMLRAGIDVHADVYKVGHHGSNTASSKAFLDLVTPKYAVISCKEGNSYGHPHAEVLNNLRAMGVLVYRTDEQGTIIATSDGRELTWNCSPSETWKAGEAGSVETEEISSEIPEEVTYVCNTNTMKFHKPSCESVKDMKNKNRLDTSETREKLISQGYVPCKRCQP